MVSVVSRASVTPVVVWGGPKPPKGSFGILELGPVVRRVPGPVGCRVPGRVGWWAPGVPPYEKAPSARCLFVVLSRGGGKWYDPPPGQSLSSGQNGACDRRPGGI